MIALLLFLLTSTPAAAEPCGERLLGYTVYETLDDGEITEHHSTFPLADWSDASAFDGIITPEPATASLEVVLRKEKRRIVKRFSFATWERDRSFARAETFHPKKFFENSESGESFILRLKENGKTLCEEIREISGD